MTVKAITEGGGQTDAVVIAGDSKYLWNYARQGMLLGLVIAVAGGIVFVAQGNVQWLNLLLALCVLPIFMGVVNAGVCLSWKTRILPVSYRVSSDGVTLLRGQDEVGHYSRADIRTATLVGAIDYRAMFTRFTFNPNWPHLRLEISHGPRYEQIDLPEIMIWGRDQATEVERVIRDTLGP